MLRRAGFGFNIADLDRAVGMGLTATIDELLDFESVDDSELKNRIAGAGLDTVGEERLPENSPLWDLPNTIITSHVAAYTDGMGNEVGGFMIENIRRFAENEPLLGIVHRHEGY